MYYNSSSPARAPEFSSYQSYYHTRYDNSYNLGSYGEPLTSSEQLDYESSLENYWKAEDDVLSRFWYTNEPNGDCYYSEEFYTCGGNWLREFESYLAGHWEEVITPYGYETSDKVLEQRTSGLEKPERLNTGNEPYGIYYNYGNDMKTAYTGNEPFSYYSNLEDTIEEDAYNHGWTETQSDVLDERRICESIFGHWPSLVQLEQESQVEA